MSTGNEGYVISGARISLPDVPADSFMRVDSTNVIVKADTAAFVAEIGNLAGQPNGVASLDAFGQVPLSQLGNAPGGGSGSGFVPPTGKGVLVTGDGTASTTLSVGANKTALIADSAQPNGIKWASYDHADLLNKGTNTHAQIDAALTSYGTRITTAETNIAARQLTSEKNQINGYAGLDGTGNVPLAQLGNVPAGTALPVTKGVLITGNGSASTNLAVGTNNQLLVADSAAATGLKWAQGDHTALSNVGTNTHAQLDAFITSKGANSGLASLDGTGQVPSTQLGNVVKPVTKGQLLVGNGTVPTTLGVGTNNHLLIADSAQATGVKWAQGDHTTLSNIGTNTHAQLDAFVTSKGAASGLATLDGTGNVPLAQLGNVPAGTTLPVTKGVLITGNGSASTNLAVGASNNQLLTVDSTTATGLKWAQGDHTTLSNVGTNTHTQIDAFITSKGAANGLASLDGTGKVTSTQLPTYSTYNPPVTKGILTTGNGTTAATLSVGTNNQVLVADSTTATGLAYKAVDHVNLTNKGTNTHAQIDDFITSKGAANGLATLDATGQVPASQLSNAPSGAAAGTLVTSTFTGAGTFDLWSMSLAGDMIGAATEAFVSANQGAVAKTGAWLLLHTIGSSLGIPDTSTPAGIVVSTQAGSALTGTSAQFAVTPGNGAGINGTVVLRVTQDATTTWTAIVRSISSTIAI